MEAMYRWAKQEQARAPSLVEKYDGGVSDSISIRVSCFLSYDCDAQKQKGVMYISTNEE